jgi:hypothetical protein
VRAVSIDLSRAVKSGARDGGGRHERVRTVLLFAQIALSAVLLIAAGLFVRSLMKVRALDLGIDTDKLVAATVYWPVPAPGDSAAKAVAAEHALIWARVRDSVAHRIDVAAATLVTGSPFRTASSVDLIVPGWDSLPVLGGGGPFIIVVGDDYCRTAGTRILSGQWFLPREGASAPTVRSRSVSRSWRSSPAQLPRRSFRRCAPSACRNRSVGARSNRHALNGTGERARASQDGLHLRENRWLIHDAMRSSTCGATVSSIVAYSAGAPVVAV